MGQYPTAEHPNPHFGETTNPTRTILLEENHPHQHPIVSNEFDPNLKFSSEIKMVPFHCIDTAFFIEHSTKLFTNKFYRHVKDMVQILDNYAPHIPSSSMIHPFSILFATVMLHSNIFESYPQYTSSEENEMYYKNRIRFLKWCLHQKFDWNVHFDYFGCSLFVFILVHCEKNFIKWVVSNIDLRFEKNDSFMIQCSKNWKNQYESLNRESSLFWKELQYINLRSNGSVDHRKMSVYSTSEVILLSPSITLIYEHEKMKWFQKVKILLHELVKDLEFPLPVLEIILGDFCHYLLSRSEEIKIKEQEKNDFETQTVDQNPTKSKTFPIPPPESDMNRKRSTPAKKTRKTRKIDL